MTLIEVIIYTALLSLLMAGFMQFVWAIHLSDLEVSQDIIDAYE